MKSTVNDLDITPLLRFLLWRNFSTFLLYDILHLFFFSFYFLSIVFPPSPIFPGNSILLYSSTSFSCLLTSIPPHSNSSINSSTFFEFSLLSQVFPSAVNPFHLIKYFSTPLIFFLFNIFSTSHFSTSSTSTGFPFSFFCPFTCSL